MGLEWSKTEIDSFDQLVEVLAGFDTSPVQLSSGELRLVINSVSHSDFQIADMSLSQKIADSAAVAVGTINFFLAERPLVWCGMEITAPALVTVESGRETRSVIEPGFASLEYFFSKQCVAHHPIGRLLSRVSGDPERSIFPLGHSAWQRLREFASTVLSLKTSFKHEDEVSDLSENIRERQLDLLYGSLAPHLAGCRKLGTRRRPRYRLALAALNLVDEIGGVGLSSAQLANTLGVSQRALQLAFRSVLQVSPAQYLLAYRLTMVRSQLMNGGGTIGEIAFRHGFNDHSRFSQQYFRIYNELPSSTLARCGQRIHERARKG